MSDLYLKANSEAALMAALTEAGLTIDGQPQAVTIHDDGSITDLYIIGTMHDADGNAIPGYHANIRTSNVSVMDSLKSLECVVNSPAFVFA